MVQWLREIAVIGLFKYNRRIFESQCQIWFLFRYKMWGE